MTGTIDKMTKVSLGIVGTLIVLAAVGGYHISNQLNSLEARSVKLEATVHGMDNTLQEVKQALNENTAQIGHDGKALAVQQNQIEALERRVLELERK